MFYKILITVVCLLFSFLSIRRKKDKKEGNYPTELDSLEIERRYFRRMRGYFISFLFLLPLVSTWFPEWAEAHNWNLLYVGVMIIILILFILPILLDEELRRENEKKDQDHYKRVD